MSPESLLQQFEVIADAPGGVQRLREIILQLAVRGKLVPQDPNDEPASVLLERIEAEKRRLYEAGKIRKPEELPPVETDEVPFNIPPTWAWSRLAMLGQVNPRNDLDDSASVSFCPMALIPERYGDPVAFEVRQWSEIKSGYTHFAENDVVVAKITPCFQNGKAAVMRGLVGGGGAGTTELYVFRPIPGTLEPDYVLIFLKSPGFIEGGRQRMTGTAGQQRVPRDYFEGTPIPVPSVAEQRRIVAKVDQLMAICDELEERHRRRAEKRVRLNRSALHHLTTATDAAELYRHWRRLHDHFDLLYEDPETVAELRQAILQLAVRGKLVPQDPNDEPASVLLERLEAEKQRLYEAGTIRKPKQLPPVAADEVPFGVPEGWEWVRLIDVALIEMGNSPPGNTYNTIGAGVPLINGPSEFSPDSLGRTVLSQYTTEPTKLCRPGDLLICVRGATTGRTNIAGFEACIGRGVALVRAGELQPYVNWYLVARRDDILAMGSGSTFPSISFKQLAELLIPIPPLPEQRRIVAKLDQLMALCDELEAKLTAARSKAEHVASAVVYRVSAA